MFCFQFFLSRKNDLNVREDDLFSEWWWWWLWWWYVLTNKCALMNFWNTSNILLFLFSFFFIRELYSAKVKHCIIKVIDDCRNRTDSKTVAIMEKSSKTLISRWQYYCKDGMLYSFKGDKKLKNCPDTTLEKIGKCASSFYKKFKENKGSRSLCRLEYCMWFSCIIIFFPQRVFLH